AALTAAVRFGSRRPGMPCPAAVFAVPMGATHAAIVQVAEMGSVGVSASVSGKTIRSDSVEFTGTDTDTPSDTSLGFRFLIVTRRLYEGLGGDPFLIADRFPPDWAAAGDLMPLEWPMEAAAPRRTVGVVRDTLKSGDSPLLLGAAQALLDGSRVLLSDTDASTGTVVRDLWKLLPDRSRCELWPATFAFSVELGFSVAVVPAAPQPWPIEYLTADQARDYPEGRYELALQIAAESDDQAELDRLFARRSSTDTLKLAALMFAAAVTVAMLSKLLS
ncbi:MAG: hypothetical protein ACRC7O_07975, partial [Fimbriiglobus sp.]